ncbi:MAG: hypothetical protein M3436_19730, partial [Pseudomonadota bacterium]|nr:hypothetical protein [Pseudomonadota bacterium]
MDLLAYWKLDNYRKDLDGGAGFHFNSRQPRLHTSIELGERLWLFTRLFIHGEVQFRLLAKLVVRSKTINPPDYKYGPYRVWGDFQTSVYYRVRALPQDDIFELLQVLPLDRGSLSGLDEIQISQACQSIRAVQPRASALLETFAAQLEIETRAKAVADERNLEEIIYSKPQEQLRLFLEKEHSGVSSQTREQIASSYRKDRQLVEELNRLYNGRCQVTGFDSPLLYGAPTAEAHHRQMEGGDYKCSKQLGGISDEGWEIQAQTPLFRAKRAAELANLLDLWREVTKVFGDKKGVDRVKALVSSSTGRDILARVIRVARAMTVGTEIADLTVCGAIAPYNHLACGKLVAMLAAKPEAVIAYKERYENAYSIIASSMAGRCVKRPAHLVFIGTSSLYGQRPNQYDRISYPCSNLGGKPNEAIRYHYIRDTYEENNANGATRGVG